MRERYIASWLDPQRFPRCLLVNPARREMVMPGPSEHHRRLSRFVLGGVNGFEKTLPFPLEVVNVGQRIARIDNDWLADAELAFLEWVPVGSFQTPLRVEDFRMHDATFARQTAHAIK